MTKNMGEQTKKTKMLGTRVSHSFYEVVKAYLAKDACINESDLIRRALAEYLENKIPETYREIMGLR